MTEIDVNFDWFESFCLYFSISFMEATLRKHQSINNRLKYIPLILRSENVLNRSNNTGILLLDDDHTLISSLV